ncbi:MAG: hypothetical protein ABR517_06805 [Thermoanaerobaculia bacterium]
MCSPRTALLFLLCLSFPAFGFAQEPAGSAKFTSERMRLSFAPAEGSFELAVFDSSPEPISATPIPGFFVDGVHQSAYAASDRAGEFRGEMGSSVSSIDRRRVLEVWPGRGEATLATSDGLRARVETRESGTFLVVESDRERPVEIRLVASRPRSDIDGATVTVEGAGAVLRFARLRRVSIPLA